MGDLVESAGLLGAILLAIAASLTLRAGVRLGFGAWRRLAATAGALALAAPAFAFATFSARAGLSGGALGATAGGFAGIAATGALTAWAGSNEKARGASTLAACAALAAAAVMVTGFDGRITMPEGRLMLLFAIAILLVSWRGRAEAAAGAPAETPARTRAGAGARLAGVALVLLGAVALTAAAWGAVAELGRLAGRRADGDLELGLTTLGLGVCLPSLVVAWRAVRRDEGGAAFVECAAAAALGLAGGLGAAALVAPITISEAFLTWPVVGLCLGAAALVVMAAVRPRPAPRLRVVGGLVYAGLLAIYARSSG